MNRTFSKEFFLEVTAIHNVLRKYGILRGRILDVGCGVGFLGHILKALGYEVLGLDIDCSKALIECIEHDARRPFPFPDSSFEVVVSQHFIEHISYGEQVNVMKEMLRVSRRIVIVLTPNKSFYWKPPDGTYHPEHVGMLDCRELLKLLKRACSSCKAEVLAVQNFAYVSSKYFRWLDIIIRFLPKPTLIGVVVKGDEE